MLIRISKELQPTLIPLVNAIKTMQEYNINDYTYNGTTLQAPDSDIDLDKAMDIARVGATITGYPIWFEIPNTSLNDNIPSGVTFSTYSDESGNTLTRQWSDITELATGSTKSIRYWQPSNNGNFVFDDVETLQDSGVTVLSKRDLSLLLNTSEFTDTGNTEFNTIETIPFIDSNWAYSYFDFVDAYLTMQSLYNEKGGTDNERWSASTLQEKKILVKWNLVGLNKAQTLVNPFWSEIRAVKEIFEKYKEFETNTEIALLRRFNDWYRYLNVLLSPSGRTKFKADWSWDLKHEYVENYLRASELGDTNLLIDWHDTTLTTYGEGDFVGQIPAATIVTGLKDVLTDNKYFV